ncbi:restriction endonuclease subunit S [Flavobacterium luminosum]|uniref:Restriction endonuclease subunit S n=1 Tax=Flavobacterium luminosum TaxID=2949086 RepID=A0ABT0TQA7_9FLAO|nr:restriction endonuclease subunit S [Flavobacterium sp. HXWNR70]MCL9809682.1 restriction endonuclease subunit S [Flavobacterium sp. HXWNR70]
MPNNWTTYKLEKVATLQRGFDLPNTKRTDGKYPVIAASGFSTWHNEFKVKGPGVTTGRSGTLGQVHFVKGDFWPLNTSLWVKDFHGNDEKFIYYFLKTLNFDEYNSGTSVPTLNRNDVHKLDVTIPDLQEQKSIAAILSAIADKIENNLAINKTLEEMAMALYKHWFVDFGPFQDGEFVESELGRIPKGWEVKSLGCIVSVLGGYAFKSAWFQETGVKVIKIKNINNNIVDINNCTCISEEISKTINPKFRIAKGDFLIAMTGAEVGKVGAVPDYGQELWLNQRVGKLVDKDLKNASILIGKLLQTSDFYKVMQGLAYGSAQPNISTSDIESIKIALPIDKSILNDIIEEFVSSHEIIIQNLTENQTLTQLRDTLLPKLISGEVRLKEFRES